MDIDAARLRQVLTYEPDTGIFRWRVSLGSRSRPGASVGCPDALGYLRVTIDKKNYKLHRLAFLYMTGEWPAGCVDHIDGDPSNNRWVNLRDVDHYINMQNRRRARKGNATGLIGATYCKQNDNWYSKIRSEGRYITLGRFSSPEEAHAAYIAAKRRLHPGNTL